MKIKDELKAQIISGLIVATIFLCVLEPLLKLFGKLVFSFSHAFYAAHLDRLFLKAALGVPPDPSLYLLGFFLALLLGFFTVFAIFFSEKDSSKDSDSKKPLRILPVKSRAYYSLLLTIMFLSFFHLYWTTWFQFKLITSFDQHLHSIAPCITEQQEKIFKSRWSLMKNEKDYDSIYADLQTIASSNNIVLPKNVIYSLNGF